MPYGLENAPVIFHRAKDINLAILKLQYALLYIDDVVIFSKTPEKHLNHVECVYR